MFKDNVIAIALQVDVPITCENLKKNLRHSPVHRRLCSHLPVTHSHGQRLMRIIPTQYTEVNEPLDEQCVPENSSLHVKEVTVSLGGES